MIAENPMKSTIYAIMGVYNREAPGDVGPSRGLTPKGLASMPGQNNRPIPNLTSKDIDRFWQKVHKSDGCWEWSAALSMWGYGKFRLQKSHSSAHRVSWVIENGPIPDGLLVCHRCDNRKCVRPDHLFLGTVQDNVADMFAKGRNRYSRDLDERQSRNKALALAYKSGEPMQDVADRFGVSISLVSRAIAQQFGRGFVKVRRNPTGFVGVTPAKSRDKWVATIKSKGEAKYLGTFGTPEDAARAFDQAARERDGDKAILNFPDLVEKRMEAA